MKNPKNNLYYFKISQKHPEKFFDSNYMFVEKDTKLSFYTDKTKKIKHKLIAIKETLKQPKSTHVINQLLTELQQELKRYANYSEFGSFVNACDSCIDEAYADKTLLKEITLLYLKKRDLNDVVPSEWIQALIDKGSSRKKGSAGEKKLIKILSNSGFVLAKKFPDFEKCKKAVARFNKRGDFSNRTIKKKYKINIGKNTQDKNLDLIIKCNNQIFFLEAKHLNTGGCGQNKQVLELVEIIRKPIKNKNFHFVSFLDGIFSNVLLNAGEGTEKQEDKNKIEKQYNDIGNALKKNPQNFWLNTAGFKTFIKDLK